ncbi:SycD/LcrH family type III secretion system chaperone [Parachitinimonas caeni]|uniref:SycD/LcrH family type III secretion system chaperone n=1 Tax=Parachitinimonas caeni TaxID=3031301 RepID=A0ABT7E190_9NEIS|nr:SycD/LcrH family type III secretion system chaperone [Parachitinimonas caeni]MDK2126056.1 SycD/LcrH family type III secretion system chaperone [Parachitinimonas caeni]
MYDAEATLLDVSTPEGLSDAMINHGVTLADLKGITAEELEAGYSYAYDAFNEGRFSDALELFLFLVTHDPFDRRFLFGYAMCLAEFERVEDALNFFTQAYLLDARDAACTLRIGECLMLLGKYEEAIEAFEATVDVSYLNPEFSAIRDVAESRIQDLKSL